MKSYAKNRACGAMEDAQYCNPEVLDSSYVTNQKKKEKEKKWTHVERHVHFLQWDADVSQPKHG